MKERKKERKPYISFSRTAKTKIPARASSSHDMITHCEQGKMQTAKTLKSKDPAMNE